MEGAAAQAIVVAHTTFILWHVIGQTSLSDVWQMLQYDGDLFLRAEQNDVGFL